MRTDRVNGPAVEGASQGAWMEWLDWLDPRRHWLRVLLLFVPIAVLMKFTGADAVWLFAAAGAAIIPLAGLLGESTEQVARKLGPGIGGLLNATFGNAAELIISLFALSRGLDSVVKASLTGSIIGNLLLVMGAAMLAGGIKCPELKFNRTAAGIGATMMLLASIGLLVPAIFHSLPGVEAANDQLEHGLSLGVSGILIVTYVLHLVFSLITHRDLYNPDTGAREDSEPGWSVTKATILLVGSTVLVAWMSEILVGAVEQASESLGMTEIFVGVIVVAIVGNAAEHSTAVLVALEEQMDLAVGIAMSSALQIALFVAPVLVFASYLREQPMDLLFSTMEIVAVILAALIARAVAEDGESNWLEGAMLLMIYALLALAFFFLPEKKASPARTGAEEKAAGVEWRIIEGDRGFCEAKWIPG
ncbi:MAG TPA: calcium/proton exchanger [Isosphaeraceae bacterium]|nr:calcium/proton exchanger [Isosphaeraceae bacterium]